MTRDSGDCGDGREGGAWPTRRCAVTFAGGAAGHEVGVSDNVGPAGCCPSRRFSTWVVEQAVRFAVRRASKDAPPDATRHLAGRTGTVVVSAVLGQAMLQSGALFGVQEWVCEGWCCSHAKLSDASGLLGAGGCAHTAGDLSKKWRPFCNTLQSLQPAEMVQNMQQGT